MSKKLKEKAAGSPVGALQLEAHPVVFQSALQPEPVLHQPLLSIA